MHIRIRTIHTVDFKSLNHGYKTLLVLGGRGVRALIFSPTRYLSAEPNESAPVVQKRQIRISGLSGCLNAIVRWFCKLLLGLRGMWCRWLPSDAMRFDAAGIASAKPNRG